MLPSNWEITGRRCGTSDERGFTFLQVSWLVSKDENPDAQITEMRLLIGLAGWHTSRGETWFRQFIETDRGETVMKRVIMVLLLGAFAGVLTGCSSSGIGSATGSSSSTTQPAASLTASDLKVVEASLITTSVIAADAAPVISASVLAGTDVNPPPFPMRGHEFRGARSGPDWMVKRGEGGCELRFEDPASMTPHIWIGRQFCQVEKKSDGTILITRPDGTVVTITSATSGAVTGEFLVDGITWTYTRSGSTLTLKDANGVTFVITEAADGRLIFAPPADHLRIGSESCKLEKSADGKILITRADGTTLTINPASDATMGELIVDGVTWTYAWGDNSVLTLKNSMNGRILIITENADGSLIVTPPGGHPHPARWTEDGSIEGSFPADGAGFQFRHGQFQE